LANITTHAIAVNSYPAPSLLKFTSAGHSELWKYALVSKRTMARAFPFGFVTLSKPNHATPFMQIEFNSDGDQSVDKEDRLKEF